MNPLDSDGTSNALHIEQLVGTLVRMHPSGRYQGYLAESWSNSDDFKLWSFKLKKDLQCEDGTPINAETFVDSFHRIISLFKKHSSLPLIDRLEGFEEFERTGHISGLTANNITLYFKFKKPVESGLLEYLALPFLGFYCSENFRADGSWKNNSSIISSASYKLDSWTGEGPVKLQIREDWFKLSDNPPKTISIATQESSTIPSNNHRSFIFSYILEKKYIPSGFTVVSRLPTIFNGIMISPIHHHWLSIKENRHLLRDAIKEAQRKIELELEGAVSIDTFYPHLSLPIHSHRTTKKTQTLKDPLVIVASKKPTPQAQYQLDVLIRALDSVQIPYTIRIRDSGQNDLMKNYRDPKNYDLQPVGVNIGGGIENQLIKFMFCSNLGVAFSDPSGRICKLVENYEARFGDSVPKEQMKEYVKEFDRIIFEDACVVPLVKTGHAWLLSKDLATDAVSPTMDTPYFDLFKLE